MALAATIFLTLAIILGLPIAVAVGVSSVLAILHHPYLPISLLAQRTYVGMDSFPLIAVPLFILAGSLMDVGGISVRITQLAQSLVGHMRGGLGMVTVCGAMIFSGISGSHTADTAAIGSVMIPTMVRKGYPPAFATAVVAASGAMGILIPPSLLLIFYGILTGTSISALFLAGLVPGIAMGVVGFLTTYWMAVKLNLPTEGKFSIRKVGEAFKRSVLSLMMPIIILSGILIGIFTPTEAAAVAVVYGLVIAKFIYKELSWPQFLRILIDSATTSGIVMLVIGTASLFGWILTSQQVPHQISESLASISSKPWVFLLLVNITFIIVHCIFEVSASLIMTLPILFPIAKAYGIDPVHFGIVLTANMGVGMITPPIGMCLCVACGISGVSIQKATPPLLPLLGTMILALAFITFVPEFTLFLPRIILGY